MTPLLWVFTILWLLVVKMKKLTVGEVEVLPSGTSGQCSFTTNPSTGQNRMLLKYRRNCRRNCFSNHRWIYGSRKQNMFFFNWFLTRKFWFYNLVKSIFTDPTLKSNLLLFRNNVEYTISLDKFQIHQLEGCVLAQEFCRYF